MSDALVMLRLKSIQTEANNIADELTRKTGTNDPRVWRKLYPNEYFLVKRKIAEYEVLLNLKFSDRNRLFCHHLQALRRCDPRT